MAKTALVAIIDKFLFKVVQVDLNQLTSTPILEDSWEPRTLGTLFETIKQKTNSQHLYLVVKPDLSFQNTLAIPSDTQDLEKEILDQIEKKLSTPQADLGIDWIKLGVTDTSELFQIFAIKKSLLTILGEAAQQSDIFIEYVESIASALIRQLSDSETPTLTLWEDIDLFAVISANTEAYSIHKLSKNNIYKDLESLLSWVTETYNLTISRIVMDENVKSISKKKLKTLQLDVEEETIDPVIGTISNEELGFEDDVDQSPFETQAQEPTEPEVMEQTEEVKDLETADEKTESSSIIKTDISAPKPPLKLVSESTGMESRPKVPSNNSGNKKFIVILLTILVVLVGLVVGGILVYRNALSDEGNQPQIIESTEPPAATPTTNSVGEASQSGETTDPSETEVDKSEIQIQILNGSGIPGEAGKVAEILEAADFTNIDTGNASSFDYTDTEVSVKPGNSSLYNLIKSTLSDDYSIAEGDELDEDSDYHVKIIVGTE